MKILIDGKNESNPAQLAVAWGQSPTFALIPAKTPVDERWVRDGLGQLPVRLQKDHFALLSSGSTGLPTLVVGSRTRAERLARVLHSQQLSEPVADTLLALPLSYCYAFVNQWVWAHVHHRRLIPTHGFSYPGTFKSALEHAEKSMLCLVGSQVPLLVRYFSGGCFPGIIRLHFAGSPFSAHHLDKLREMFPNAVMFNNYGCVEAMPRLTLRRIEDSHDPADVGRPVPGVVLNTATDGKLQFVSPYSAVALIDADGIRELRDGEPLLTGDCGIELGNGSWQLHGRSNEVFKRFGEKISLLALLETVQSVWTADAVCYRTTDSLGEAGYVLVLSPAPDDGDLRAVLHAFRAHHPRTHWPLRIESVETMPLLDTKKVDLKALAANTEPRVHWTQRIDTSRTPTS